MKLYNNIDLVQINVKQGVDEYYLPKNVNWRNRVIDQIVLVAPLAGMPTMLSPIDAQTRVMDAAEIEGYNLFFDLYSSDDRQIVRNLSFVNVLATNSHALELKSTLSLNLSRLFFTNAPSADGCLLLYVIYGTKEVEYFPTTKSVTVSVPLEAMGAISLQDIVDNYIMMQPETIKGMYVWNCEQTPVFISLRDKDALRTLNYVSSMMCRPPIITSAGDAERTQLYEMRFDGLNIDMLNSWVENAQNTDVSVRITFNY